MKPSKRYERLQRRIKAWRTQPAANGQGEAKVVARYAAGGYKCPGSRTR